MNDKISEELQVHLDELKYDALVCLQTIHPIDAGEAMIEYLKSCHCSYSCREMVLRELAEDEELKKILENSKKIGDYYRKLIRANVKLAQKLEKYEGQYKPQNSSKTKKSSKMELISKFRGDYYTVNSDGENIIVPNIEREVWYDEELEEEFICLHPNESLRIHESLRGEKNEK